MKIELQKNLMLLPPKVAFLDDDKEFISDLKECLNDHIEIEVFNSVQDLLNQIKQEYHIFLKHLSGYFALIQQKNIAINIIKNKFNELLTHRPFSVGLIDLNLGKSHLFEGFEISELLVPFGIKTIIYSAADFDEMTIDLMNQGVISGYVCKSSDLFEDLIPAIFLKNQEFYAAHFNITHLFMIEESFNFSNPKLKDRQLNYQDTFIVYNSDFNYLTNNI